jgi:hypothetical protein
VDGEGFVQTLFGEVVGALAHSFGKDNAGSATPQGAVRRLVVMRLDESTKDLVHVFEGGDLAQEVEAALAQRAPEALHLAASGRVVGRGMKQRDAQALARQAQRLAAIGGAVIEVERVGRAMAAQRAYEEAEHVDLALAVVRFEGDDKARVVIEERVDAQRFGDAANHYVGAMADVSMPKRPRALGLPAQARAVGHARAERYAIEALLDEEAAHRGLGDGALVEASIGDERAQDERYRCIGMLPADIAQQRALCFRERLRAAFVTASLGTQRRQPTCFVLVEPALEAGDGVAARVIEPGRPVATLAERAQLVGELAVVEVAARQRTDDLAAKQRDGFAVIGGDEWVGFPINGHGGSFRHRRVVGKRGAPVHEKPFPRPRSPLADPTWWVEIDRGSRRDAHQGICTAPKKARSASAPVCSDGGACAPIAIAARPATSRRACPAGIAGTAANRSRDATASIQRDSVTQRR